MVHDDFAAEVLVVKNRLISHDSSSLNLFKTYEKQLLSFTSKTEFNT